MYKALKRLQSPYTNKKFVIDDIISNYEDFPELLLKKMLKNEQVGKIKKELEINDLTELETDDTSEIIKDVSDVKKKVRK